MPRTADAEFYQLYFQEPGVADADLGNDAATTMRRLLTSVRMSEGDSDDASDEGAVGPGDMAANDGRGFVDRLPEPTGLPDWLSQEELDHYIEEFSRTGFTGGINWYRNIDRNWDLTEHVKDDKVQMPSLFIGGALDPVLLMSNPANAHDWLSDHRGDVLIEHAGHWVQQEKADEVNKALLDFLAQVVR
jgi:pimeloyl-ACP methyl ester carboxylesterase